MNQIEVAFLCAIVAIISILATAAWMGAKQNQKAPPGRIPPRFWIQVINLSNNWISWNETFRSQEEAEEAYHRLASQTFPEPSFAVVLAVLDNGKPVIILRKGQAPYSKNPIFSHLN